MFLQLYIVLILFFNYHVLKKGSLFNLCLFTYYMVYLYIAPIFQIYYKKFPNNLIFIYKYAFINVLMSTLFLIVYMFIDKSKKYNLASIIANKIVNYLRFTTTNVNLNKLLPYFILISMFLIYFMRNYLIDVLIIAEGNIALVPDNNVRAIQLIIKKFLFFVGIIPFLIAFSKLKFKNNSLKTILFFLLTFAIAFIFKNPFNEKRGVLGSIYLSWFFYFILLKKNFVITKKTLIYFFIFLFLSLLFLYPTVKVFTHLYFNFAKIVEEPSRFFDITLNYLTNFERNITSLDYDSWINAQFTFEYIDKFGYKWGKQTLTSLLFFVPRSIYKKKGEGTGGIIGDYIISNYGGFQRQISNPVYSEAFFDLSIFGLFLYAMFLNFLSKTSSYLKKTNNNYLILYSLFIDFYVLFLFRGDFISCLAYFVGYSLATISIPFLIIKLQKLFTKKLILLSYEKSD
ncbi:oligosaccharide repeat unit polymerase [Thermosipho ferrireducens]|uniref:Oligosaccharide repeat unit polymerase n=1 Tax=Thermosipho ferrireducens TaxID=2571116 RepID=A0ABX7S7B5_9BACT|nr:O-antigen polymerase [Thermosipho ferrireducens]QTA38482.1 oligosaccharide repeat unit polymerase [Thermosipho ferrireducens]